MEKVRPWCGQPSDRGRLKIRSDQLVVRFSLSVSVVRHETLLILFFLSATLRFKQQLNNLCGLHCTSLFRTCVFQYLRFQRPRCYPSCICSVYTLLRVLR